MCCITLTDDAEKGRLLQRIALQDALIPLIARGPDTLPALLAFSDALQSMLQRPRPDSEFVNAVCADALVLTGAVRALAGISQEPVHIANVKTVMQSQGGALLLASQAVRGTGVWQDKHSHFLRMQSAMTELSPELKKHKDGMATASVKELESAAQRLPVFMDSLAQGLGHASLNHSSHI